MSVIEKLNDAKSKANQAQIDRDNYAAYIAQMREFGWTEADISEYRAEVERIMKSGSDDEKKAASDFWRDKAGIGTAKGINRRIQRSIEDEKRLAA